MLVNKIPDIIELGKPASSAEIQETETKLGVRFPAEYRDLLAEANGVCANLVQLYSCEDIPERNETYEVPGYAPGYILIGSVNCAPVLLKSGKKSPVYQNDWGAMVEDCMVELATSLSQWINKGCPDEERLE